MACEVVVAELGAESDSALNMIVSVAQPPALSEDCRAMLVVFVRTLSWNGLLFRSLMC
jgi:hypothetical protein